MRDVYLCGGLQSSGSTLLSWCFLQRHDMDGILDQPHDRLPELRADLGRPLAWCKVTISCFRMSEVIEHLEPEGWRVHPLLLVRDVRTVWASLQGKAWGTNSTTAEDPPLRLRFLRFLDDWRAAREQGWPVVQYERLVEKPRGTLEVSCRELGLPWDEAMLRWSKPPEEIADASSASRFVSTRRGGLEESLERARPEAMLGPIPAEDLCWLEERFAAFHRELGYPEHREAAPHAEARLVPDPALARRVEWKLRRKPLRYLQWKLRRRFGRQTDP